MSRRPRIYIASKITHAAKWRTLQAIRKEFDFIMVWPNWVVERGGDFKDPKDAGQGWVENEHDVQECDFLIAYAEPSEVLRGALVEAGMAIALGKRVIVVGESESYGTWQFHPMVHRAPNLEAALDLVRDLHAYNSNPRP